MRGKEGETNAEEDNLVVWVVSWLIIVLWWIDILDDDYHC